MATNQSSSPTTRHLAKAGAGTALVSGIRMFVGFGVAVLIARLLGPSEFGTYSIALSIVTVLSVFTRLGLPFPLLRDVAALRDSAESAKVRSLIKGAQSRVAGASVLGGLGLGAGILLLGRDAPWAAAALVALVLALPLSLEMIHSAGLRALGSIPLGHASAPLMRETLFLIAIGGLFLTGIVPATAVSSITIHAAAGVVAVVISGMWLANRVPASCTRHQGIRLRGAASFLSLEAVQTTTGHLDVLLLAILLSPSEVGIYKVALAVGLLTAFFGNAAVLVSQPEFARTYAKGDHEGLQRLATFHVRVTSLATAPLLIAFVLLGPAFLNLFYGPEYQSAYAPLVLIALAQLFNVITGAVGTILNMTGHQGETLRAYAGSAILALASLAVLAPAMGLVGAGVAHLVGVAAANSFLVIRVRQLLAVKPTIIAAGLVRQSEAG